jgi:hypothetical protein
MKRRASKTTLKKLSKRADLPCVGFEMDWVFFYAKPKGRWRWGNPRRLWGVPTEQERRADEDEKQQLKEMGL